MLTVSIASTGSVNLYSDSFATFPGSIPYYQGGNGEYLYGNPSYDLTIFNVYADSITISAFYGSAHVSGSNGITWKGRKVH
jgi:small ligand-binding sensory domain FIST